jgi:6-phosphogluconolactonase (cycloisomerase 2 family)
MVHRRPTKRSIEFCGLETLETRRLMAAGPFPQASSYIYTETDNSNPGQNAVIAFRRDWDGQVTEIGSFLTGGTGFANPQGLLGPDDSDKEVIASPDGDFVFAVNQGSNSVAVFRVEQDGSLELVHHTAVSSGGTEPASLSIAGDRLYVVNRGDEAQGETGTIPPTITVFHIGRNGVLKQDTAATTTLSQGLSPSQLLISAAGNLAFLDNFTPPPLNNVTEANEVVPFQIAANGKLRPVSSGGVGAPVNPPLLLGLAQNPTQNIIYAGLTGAAKVGVFTFDRVGDLTLVDTVAVSGQGPCWALVSPNGAFLYTTDAAGTFPQGNALHVLTVAPNGTLGENASSPLLLPSNIPAGADPQGVAVIAA